MNDVVGWLLDETEREELLRRFPPVYPDVVAHHVTLRAKTPADGPLPTATAGEIVGHVDDGRGLQALVVRIDGTTERPDGSTYHITWSLDRNQDRRPVESNHVLAEEGWTPCSPVPIRLIPARF
ncbi:hypothetical protein [Microvirga roseola]|uniref:hypothetical protein n=1 Tax=Microvirga roseola TaxID=2883126 RepID=UPI001E5A375E|nr:hypothetical protein [Microvirga roseola]